MNVVNSNRTEVAPTAHVEIAPSERRLKAQFISNCGTIAVSANCVGASWTES